MAQRLYLDHAATTPVGAAARAAHADALASWANASSPHQEGRASRAGLQAARRAIADALGWTGEIVLTGGATEAIAIAMTHSVADARLMSTVEHLAVHRAGGDAYMIPVGTGGMVAPDALAGRLGALGAARPLVAIQHVNNETGVIQPLAELLPVIARAGGISFVDCAQTAGKLALPPADLIAVSAHKLGGPPGVGALLVRDFALLRATGGQEQGYRAGTENVPGACSFAAALGASRSWLARAGDLRDHLDHAIDGAGGQVIARTSSRLATIASYRMPGVTASAQLIQFDLAGIAVSAGSACSSGTLKPSHVLAAMGLAAAVAAETIRVSFGPDTGRADIYRFVEAWRRVASGGRA